MRIPIIAGNWKLNKTCSEAEALVKELLPLIEKTTDVEVVVCPPFTALALVGGLLKGSRVKLGAQNCYYEMSGAFTGEISPPMLKDLGCAYCIVGHSERRQYFGETDPGVNKKAKALIATGLVPIVCVGETLDQRESGQTMAVVERQVRGAYEGISRDEAAVTVIAYEPVWAIGTGKTATPTQAEEVHAGIRSLLAGIFDKALAEGMRIQYGGSVKPANAMELMAQPDIDGGLIGGACLAAGDFAAIVNFRG